MANNVRQGFGNSPLDVYLSFPPVTRTLVTTFAATALVTSLGFVDGRLLLLSWPAIFSRYFQVWRLVTSFLFLGPFSLYWLITSLWTIQYGKAVEARGLRGDSAEYLFMLLFGGSSLLVVSLLLKPFLRINLLAPSAGIHACVHMEQELSNRQCVTLRVVYCGRAVLALVSDHHQHRHGGQLGQRCPWCLCWPSVLLSDSGPSTGHWQPPAPDAQLASPLDVAVPHWHCTSSDGTNAQPCRPRLPGLPRTGPSP
eukprot:jgi/Botrbrau1/10032/Bobra.0012s0119.1